VIDAATAPYAALVLRLTHALLFAAHAYFKVGVRGMDATRAFFRNLGYPPLLAYVAVAMEIVAVPMLVAGVHTRWVCMAMSPILICATHAFFHKGWNFTNGGYEFPAIWLVMLGVQALLGDGAYALGVPM
jgi:putative oxidoreductase